MGEVNWKGLLSVCQTAAADKGRGVAVETRALQETESNFRNHKININVCKNKKVCLASEEEKAPNV